MARFPRGLRSTGNGLVNPISPVNAHPQPTSQDIPSGPHKAVPSLRTLLVADWVESTALVEKVGDRAASQLSHLHDQLLDRLLARCQGRLIDKADGLFALFSRPVQALDFAFRYQEGLRALAEQVALEPGRLAARVGIHVGEVLLWANPPERIAQGAKAIEVEGLAKPVAARLMSLALPNQILMSGMTQTLAHRAQDELAEFGKVQWLVHGRYRFKGVPAPMVVHEAGLAGRNPLRLPPSGDKAKREVPLWRQPVVLAMEGALAAGLLGFGVWSVLKSPPAIAFAERDWVVLGDVQNLTGDTRFDASLDAAARIALEQSTFVNVLPDSQESEALRLMRREDAGIDRGTGVEVALRMDAKALVLPTVSEVGNRIRVSAEVIDPSSGVTAYTQTAEVRERDNVLDALDRTLAEVRERLGEDDERIARKRVSLPKATTANLDALRAFALGNEAYTLNRMEMAKQYFQQAVSLDPQFALAHIGLVRVATNQQDFAARNSALDAALKHRERLSDRERLYLDATRAYVRLEPDLSAKWRALSDNYPDYPNAAMNAAQFLWHNNEYAQAKMFLSRAASPHSPLRHSAGRQMVQTLQGLGEVDAARAAYRESLAAGVEKDPFWDALLEASMGNTAAAMRISSSAKPGNIVDAYYLGLLNLSLARSTGDDEAALSAVAGIERSAAQLPEVSALAARNALRLDELMFPRPGKPKPRAARHLKDALIEWKSLDGSVERELVALSVMLLAREAAGQGESDLAMSVRREMKATISASPYQILGDAAALLDSRLADIKGDKTLARELLEVRRRENNLWLLQFALTAAGGEADEASLERKRPTAFSEWAYFRSTLYLNALHIHKKSPAS